MLIKISFSSLIFVLSREVKCIFFSFVYNCIVSFSTLLIFVSKINDIEKKGSGVELLGPFITTEAGKGEGYRWKTKET